MRGRGYKNRFQPIVRKTGGITTMNRIGGLTLLAALALPAALEAQRRPSNSMHTRSAEVYLERAKSTSREADRRDLLTKALEALRPGMTSDADNPRIWLLAGQAYARLGDAAGADSAFDRAESLYPEYAKEIEPERLSVWVAQYNLGVTALPQQQYDEAIARFEAADRIYRGRPEAALSLGSVYVQKGDLAKAEAAYRVALEIAQGPAGANVAEKDRAQWLEQERTAASRLASLLDQLGRRDDAVAVHRAYVDKHPEDAAARAEWAAALAKSGKTEEAARVYEQLLASGDLSDTEWFNAGVGLYAAEQHGLAARAFRKSVEKNPHARDAWYNLGQTLFGATSALEERRKSAAEPDKAELGKRIEAVNTELLEVSAKVREFDPNFRNAMMMVAQAQRTLSDLTTDAALKKQWQDKVVATLEQAEALPFEVSGITVRAQDGGVTVSGRVTNLKAAAGQTLTLEFSLLGDGGEVLATVPVTAALKEANASTEFSFEAKTDKPVAGWKYRSAS
jgi:tetratricopeptide (TPR) repeat protein